jgi:hypothetical protein
MFYAISNYEKNILAPGNLAYKKYYLRFTVPVYTKTKNNIDWFAYSFKLKIE